VLVPAVLGMPAGLAVVQATSTFVPAIRVHRENVGMMSRLLSVMALAAAAFTPVLASAYEVDWRSILDRQNAAHWPSFPIGYIIRSDQIPLAWRDAVENMMREWEYPTNRDEDNLVWWSRRFETERWRPEQDGDNHMTWIWQQDNYREVRGVDDATARTILATERTYFNGIGPWHIIESDIFFNAAYHTWVTASLDVCGTSIAYLLQRTALHELGHMIGLEHSTDANAILASTQNCNDAREILERDDINGLDYLYEADDPIHNYDP
jgi:Matrixin